MQRDHPPRFRHDAAELALHSDSLSEHSDIGRQYRKQRGPISAQYMTKAAMRDADENQNIRNAIGQIIQNFPAPTGFPRRERDHAIEHVEPESQVTESRTQNQKPGR